MSTDTTTTFEDLCVILNYKPTGRLLTNDEAAEVLRVKPTALNYQRWAGKGPRYMRHDDSRRVLYSERDVLFYLWQGMRTSTSDRAAPAQHATA